MPSAQGTAPTPDPQLNTSADDDLNNGRLMRARSATLCAEAYVARPQNDYRRREILKVVSWLKSMIQIEFADKRNLL